MDWDSIVLNFTEVKYAEYNEWLEKIGHWDGTAEHVIHTMKFNALNNSTHNLLFHYKLCSTEEPIASNICVESLCGELYPFIKPLPVRYKQSESFLSIDYKTPQVLREDKYVGNIPHDKPPEKTGEKNETNKYGYLNSTNMTVLIKHNIYGHKLLLLPQEYGPNEIIGYTFLLLAQ